MTTVKLIKALSYSGAVKATREQPYVNVNTEEEAQALVNTGFFSVCASPVPDNGSKDDKGDELPDYEALSEMTKAELAAYAENNQIDIEGCKTKADILEAISVANGGSYAMLGLQEDI